MSYKTEKSNAVSFGKYGIHLAKEQLFFYNNGELMRVRDVSYDFSQDDLLRLAQTMAEKQDLTAKFCLVSDIVKK